MCSQCHKLPVSRTWGVTVGFHTYCQACVPRINVSGQHYTLANEGAQSGSKDTSNSYLVCCPNSGEGCKWNGEIGQLENHLNPQPTTADSLLDGCQFQTLHFKCQRYEVKPQTEPLLEQARKLIDSTMKQVIDDSEVTRKQVEELQMNGLSLHSKCNQMMNEVNETTANSINELRALTRNELLKQEQTLNSIMKDNSDFTRKQVEELRMNGLSLESRCEHMINEVKEKTANSVNELWALMQDEFLKQEQKLNSTMQDDSDITRKQVEELRMNGLSLESKCEQMMNEVNETTANSVNELRTHIQEFKVVIACIVLSLLVVLIAGGLNVYLNSSSEIPDDKLLTVMVMNGMETAKNNSELRMNGLSLDSKYKQMVKEMKETTNSHMRTLSDKFSYLQDQIEAIKSKQSVLESKCREMITDMAEEATKIMKLETRQDLLLNQVESLESYVYDLNSSLISSQQAQEVLNHAESIEFSAENDEWIKGEITDLNQQVDSIALPQYKMSLSRRQGSYMVSAPFYTEDQGYRMRALAYPRNNSDKMVICLCILKGKYDQTLQWPLNARFTVTLYVNETGGKTDEISFPSYKHSNDCFIYSTKDLFMIKDGSSVEYGIRMVQNITATVFHLDIVKKSSWWDFVLQIVDFMVRCSVYLWYAIVTLSTLLVLWCFCLCVHFLSEIGKSSNR